MRPGDFTKTNQSLTFCMAVKLTFMIDFTKPLCQVNVDIYC